MKKEELADAFIIKINYLISIDEFALGDLLSYRTGVNDLMVSLKQIPLKKIKKQYHISTVSLLNFIIGPIEDGPFEGQGFISIMYDNHHNVIGVERTDFKTPPLLSINKVKDSTKETVTKLNKLKSSFVNSFSKRLLLK